MDMMPIETADPPRNTCQLLVLSFSALKNVRQRQQSVPLQPPCRPLDQLTRIPEDSEGNEYVRSKLLFSKQQKQKLSQLTSHDLQLAVACALFSPPPPSPALSAPQQRFAACLVFGLHPRKATVVAPYSRSTVESRISISFPVRNLTTFSTNLRLASYERKVE
eukprot:2221011-Rhodomonas_salina.2